MAQQQQQDVETLKRRGRRRLVGAIALVLLAVIVLPWIFDQEPRPGAPPVSVRIPGENEAPFKPRSSPEKADKNAPASAQYMVAVGAFANPESVLARLAEAKLPYTTEKVATAKGGVTRVRAGPFATREAAEHALEKLKAMGFKPGSVSARPA
jgi:DedD protein